MGMSTHVVGIVMPDQKWQKMKAVYDACTAAGIEVPSEVRQFFNHRVPDPAGTVFSLDNVAREWQDDTRGGLEIDLSEVPDHVTVLRFYNSW